MSNSFGPWTTAMTMSSPQRLSTFWKKRLTMLLPTSRTAAVLSRRGILSLVAAGVLACLLPTFRHAPVQAQPQKANGDVKAKGRIYVTAWLRYKPEGKDEEKTYVNAIFGVDPATGKWQKITDEGFNGRVSPDGQTLIFSQFTKPFGPDNGIWNCDTGGTDNPAKISDKRGRAVWSADGKHIVATKTDRLSADGKVVLGRPGEPPVASLKCETWRIDADGSNPIKLPIPDTDSVQDWSPDGKWFLIHSDRQPRGVYVIKTDGTERRILSKGYGARFSPDGRKILYSSRTGNEGSFWIMDVNGKNAREIFKEVGLVIAEGAFWSPDGNQVAVIVTNCDLIDGKKGHTAGEFEKQNYRIEIMDADGKNRRELKLADGKFLTISALGDWR